MFFGFNLYSGLLLPFFVQGLVVAAVLWGRRQREELAADGWLALLLLLFVGRLAQWMLGFGGWYDSHDGRTTFMFYWPFSNWLAVGPALYFYFRSLTNQEFRIRRRDVGHFGPVLAYLGWRVVVFGYDIGWWHGVQGQLLPYHFGTKGPLANWAEQLPIGLAANALGYVLVLFYTVRSLREYRSYARYLNDNFSATDQIRFRWLRNVLVAVGVGTGITLVFGIISTLVTPLNYYEAWWDYLFTGVLVYYLSIAGLLTGHRLAALRFQPVTEPVSAVMWVDSAQRFQPLSEPDLAVANAPFPPNLSTAPAPEKAAPSTEPELLRWTSRVVQFMEVERPYLEPELTLGQLADRLSTNTSWLSRVINSGCGQNFNDFINEYRVREAERLLRAPQFRHYTLLAVALEAGFNSKSTFNRVFRKLRGITPGQAGRAADEATGAEP